MVKSRSTRQQKKLQNLLVEARQRADLTQVTVAKRLRRPQSFVSKYEIGERRLDVVEFLAVTKAIEADPSRILEKLQHRSRSCD